MGERKGVNKYYPPDYDPKKGGLNKFQGTHALRERARKLHLGILIIRFELPYNIWCDGCENHIGTGVRYNAEKTKVGMYYSTPVYQFRMKCHLCTSHFEIKTDPANLDYIIVTGARRQERRWDPDENEQVAPEDKEVTRKLAADSMFRLEHGVTDKTKATEVDPVLKSLEDFQDSRWKDDYAANQVLRESMRKQRNKAKAQAKIDASYNLNIDLLSPSKQDTKDAQILQFTRPRSLNQRSEIDAQSIFQKLKPKRISQSTKKQIAKNSLTELIKPRQKDFTNYKSNFNNLNLGIVHKSKQTTGNISQNPDNYSIDDVNCSSCISVYNCSTDHHETNDNGNMNTNMIDNNEEISVIKSNDNYMNTKETVNKTTTLGLLVNYGSSGSDSDL